ncbi:hypothetical protein AB0H83_36435 [Dactylosporangium sp. NPDC050688]|uniref:hypothetical protein n=1 Tax=Dactylosporangium sp. NPDC050688 TaxID=3157217 RepID=UPI003409315D
MRGRRWIFAICAWTACTAALSMFGVGRVEAVRTALLASITRVPAPAATPSAAPSSSPTSGVPKLLRTPGGNIAARCDAGMVWADSLSPAFGFRIEGAQQGPGAEYRLTFRSDTQVIHVAVRCKDRTPEAQLS